MEASDSSVRVVAIHMRWGAFALVLHVDLLVTVRVRPHVHRSGGEQERRVRLFVVNQAGTYACTDSRLAVAAEALAEQTRDLAVSERNVAGLNVILAARLADVFLRALRQQGYAVAEGSD